MKAYCFTSFSENKCPNCDSELIATEYYSAIEGNTSLVNKETDYAKWKTITTTSTRYSDIKKHTGSICLNCFNRANNPKRVFVFIILGTGALCVLLAIIFAIVFSMSSYYFIISAIIAVIAFVYIYFIVKKEDILHYSVDGQSLEDRAHILSLIFVQEAPKFPITWDSLKGRVILSPSFVRSLKN